jgi:hypothetical protein
MTSEERRAMIAGFSLEMENPEPKAMTGNDKKERRE